MNWRVFAETKGLLTFPPERTAVRIGNVEIALKDDSQALTEPKHVMIQWDGPFSVEIPGVIGETQPPVTLIMNTLVQAQTGEEALSIGHEEIEEALTLLTLASGGQIAPSLPIHAQEELPEGSEATFVQAASGSGSVIAIWDDQCENRVRWITDSLRGLSAEDAHCLRVALHWWRRSRMESERHTLFMFQWFALDALAAMSFSFPSKPGGMNKAQHLLVNTTRLWSTEEFQLCYGSRCAIAHGDTEITPMNEVELEPKIQVQHSAIETIIYAIIQKVYQQTVE
jgi:hypothetical protein